MLDSDRESLPGNMISNPAKFFKESQYATKEEERHLEGHWKFPLHLFIQAGLQEMTRLMNFQLY